MTKKQTNNQESFYTEIVLKTTYTWLDKEFILDLLQNNDHLAGAQLTDKGNYKILRLLKAYDDEEPE